METGKGTVKFPGEYSRLLPLIVKKGQAPTPPNTCIRPCFKTTKLCIHILYCFRMQTHK